MEITFTEKEKAFRVQGYVWTQSNKTGQRGFVEEFAKMHQQKCRFWHRKEGLQKKAVCASQTYLDNRPDVYRVTGGAHIEN